MDTPKLAKVIREPNGTVHIKGEPLVIKTQIKQANFSNNTLVKVLFPRTNSECMVFSSEIDYE